jgi:replicative DNA helicase
MSARPEATRNKRIDELKVPPQAIEAEQAVLGGLMLSPESINHLGDLLIDADFYLQAHRVIYKAIIELSGKQQPYDAITIGEWLQANNLSTQVGGTEYLIDLVSQTPSAANIKAWAEIVREKSILRQLIEAGTDIVNNGFVPDGREIKQLLAEAEQSVFKIAEQGARAKKSFVAMKDAAKDAYEQIIKRFDNQGSLSGLPSGFSELDKMTSGLQNQDLIILAARPAMGKTTLALNIAEYAAMKTKKAVAVYSMEMSSAQLAQRLLSSIGRINANNLRSGELADEDWSRLTSAIKMLTDTKIFIDDTPALSPHELAFRARRLKREHDLGLIVVDYLQLMQVPGNKENRATEISEISRSLKALAKELDIPIIALSQLNRGLESRTDKRPIMSDLRESGGIEQDADIILFIYRDEYYNKENSPDKGLAEIIVSKHRNGETGSFKLKFFGEYTKFENLAYEQHGSFE